MMWENYSALRIFQPEWHHRFSTRAARVKRRNGVMLKLAYFSTQPASQPKGLGRRWMDAHANRSAMQNEFKWLAKRLFSEFVNRLLLLPLLWQPWHAGTAPPTVIVSMQKGLNVALLLVQSMSNRIKSIRPPNVYIFLEHAPFFPVKSLNGW